MLASLLSLGALARDSRRTQLVHAVFLRLASACIWGPGVRFLDIGRKVGKFLHAADLNNFIVRHGTALDFEQHARLLQRLPDWGVCLRCPFSVLSSQFSVLSSQFSSVNPWSVAAVSVT